MELSEIKGTIGRVEVNKRTNGTAFLIARDRVITALHVLGGHKQVHLVFVAWPDNERERVATLLWRHPDGADLAILAIDKPCPSDISPIGWLREPPTTNAQWSTFGFPAQLQNGHALSEGAIKDPELRIQEWGFNVMQLHTPIAAYDLGGFSGAPCIVNGGVVGVVTHQFRRISETGTSEKPAPASGKTAPALDTLYALPLTLLESAQLEPPLVPRWIPKQASHSKTRLEPSEATASGQEPERPKSTSREKKLIIAVVILAYEHVRQFVENMVEWFKKPVLVGTALTLCLLVVPSPLPPIEKIPQSTSDSDSQLHASITSVGADPFDTTSQHDIGTLRYDIETTETLDTDSDKIVTTEYFGTTSDDTEPLNTNSGISDPGHKTIKKTDKKVTSLERFVVFVVPTEESLEIANTESADAALARQRRERKALQSLAGELERRISKNCLRDFSEAIVRITFTSGQVSVQENNSALAGCIGKAAKSALVPDNNIPAKSSFDVRVRKGKVP